MRNLRLLSVGLLAVFFDGCAVEALVPTRQNWRCQPVTSLVSRQQSPFFLQQKRSSRIARAATTYGATSSPYTSQQAPGTIQDLLFFTNQERLRMGLPELRYNKDLEKAAQRHAVDMAKKNYFSHDGQDGSDLKDRVALTEYRYTNVGENLFWRTPDNDPAYAVQGWMESPGHRKNMLDQQFTEIGLGYAVDQANGKHYYVQVFGRPLDTPDIKSPQDTRETMFRATNEARLRQGLPPYAMSQELNQGAQEHAEDMMRSGKLTSKLKRGSYDRFFTLLGARFAAREIFNDPHGAVKGWLEKGPQSDILSERFTETGIGYASDGEQHYYVQLFGSPMETGVGRRDFTRPGATSRNPAVSMPQQTEEKLDKARNGDFGRMGFGKLNRDRRHDADELDDQWNDDRRVLAQFQSRRPLRPAADMRRGQDDLRPSKSDGFDSKWNDDYKGTANTRNYRMGPTMDARERSQSMNAGGGAQMPPMRSQQELMNPSDPRYGQFNRGQQSNNQYSQSNTGYSQADNRYSRTNNGYSQADNRYSNANNGYSQANNGYSKTNNGYSQANNGYSKTNNGFSQANNGYPSSGMTRSSGQPRRATASAFGQPSRDGQRGSATQDSVNDIHYQRYLQMNGGINGEGRMDENMMFGRSGPGMAGLGMMGMYDRQMPTPMRRDYYPEDRNIRNQMRDPNAYGRYDFGQPHNQSLGPMNDYMRSGPMNIGMGANSEHGRGEYYIGQYSRMGPMDYGWNENGMRGVRGIQPDNFGP